VLELVHVVEFRLWYWVIGRAVVVCVEEVVCLEGQWLFVVSCLSAEGGGAGSQVGRTNKVRHTEGELVTGVARVLFQSGNDV